MKYKAYKVSRFLIFLRWLVQKYRLTLALTCPSYLFIEWESSSYFLIELKKELSENVINLFFKADSLQIMDCQNKDSLTPFMYSGHYRSINRLIGLKKEILHRFKFDSVYNKTN